jgi:hypothetical protein
VAETSEARRGRLGTARRRDKEERGGSAGRGGREESLAVSFIEREGKGRGRRGGKGASAASITIDGAN